MKKASSDRLLQFVEVLILTLALTATWLIAGQVRDQTELHFARQRTSDIVARHNQGEIRELRSTFDRWRSTNETPVDLLTRAHDDPMARQTFEDIRDYANFFQELGAAAHFGTLDLPYLRRLFQSRVRIAVTELEPFILAVRALPDVPDTVFFDALELRDEFAGGR